MCLQDVISLLKASRPHKVLVKKVGIPQVKQLEYIKYPINKDLLLSVSRRGGDLPSGVWESDRGSSLPMENGIKASFFLNAPLASRKCSGLKSSGFSKYCGSWRAEVRME
jgi:hypothetical protein